MEAIDIARCDVPLYRLRVALGAARDIERESADVVTKLKALTCGRVVDAAVSSKRRSPIGKYRIVAVGVSLI